jgi:hypothetical protein
MALVLLPKRLAPGIADGSVTLVFRRWARREAIAGRTYRTAAGRVDVVSVTLVAPEAITDPDARRAGYADAGAARADLRGDPALPVSRVELRPATAPDPRAALAADDALDAAALAGLERRLAGMDARSERGPWTTATLTAIAAHPALRAGDLAAAMGVERLLFKRDVRKLKALGLTESLPVGYRLSPRGQALLDARGVQEGPLPVERVRRLVARLPGVVERPSYGTPAFFAGARGKLVARMREDERTLVLRVEPAAREALLLADPAVFHLTPHYVGSPLVLVRLGAVGDRELGELLEEAWALVAPRKLVAMREGSDDG